MKSLVELALTKQLPLIQLMDRETIDWIENNRPAGFDSRRNFKEYTKLGLELLDTVKTIEKSWFLEPLLYDSGVHGARHLWRTAVYSYIINDKSSIPRKQARQVLAATIVHDIRRIQDKRDEDHEKRAAVWFARHSSELATVLNTTWDTNEVSNICTIISSDDVLNDDIDALRQIKNTSDALDRYRAARLDWRPNDRYIKTKLPDNIHCFAFALVVESERIALKNTDHKKSIHLALENLAKPSTNYIEKNMSSSDT